MAVSIRKFLSSLLFVIFIFLLGFSATVKAEITVLTSIKPLAVLLSQLVAPGDQVEQLLAADRSPHHYQLKASERKQLGSADLVVWIGPELESFLEKPLSQRKQGVYTLADLEGLHWPEEGHQDEHDSHQHDHHNHSSHRDPHLWLDPHNLSVITRALTKTLIKQSPQQAETYRQNSAKVLNALTALDKKLKSELLAIADKPFIVLHPAYNHFVERYALNQLDYIVITPERGIGAKHLYELKKQSVRCVFSEQGQNSQLVNQLAQDINARTAMLDPMGAALTDSADAGSVIRQLADTLLGCLE